MAWLKVLAARLYGTVCRGRLDRDLDQELQTHVEMLADDYMSQGLSPRAARRAARLRLGGVEQTMEAVRDRRGLAGLESVLQDVRHVARLLRKNPSFTAGAVVTLAIGIGANVAIFSVVNGLLLRPLPFPHQERLVYVQERLASLGDGAQGVPVAFPNFVDWRARQRVFDAIALYQEDIFALSGSGDPEHVLGALATADLFTVLGVPPSVGRVFRPEEDRPGGERVVILSHGLWQQRYGGRPVVGDSLLLDGAPHVILAVMPPDFRFPGSAELWVPASVDPQVYPRGRHSFEVVARLKAGVTIVAAQSEMDAVARQLAREYPEDNTGATILLQPLREGLVASSLQRAFLVFMGAVAFVLLIACANLANLLLSRGASRDHEMAVRAALGANRWRLVQQLLIEALLLSTAGAGLGLLVGWFGRDLLLAAVPTELPVWVEFDLDARVMGFLVLLTALTAVVSGLAPALRGSTPGLSDGLKQSGTRTTTDTAARLRGGLVVAEVALALVLLVASGLMTRALLKLLQVDPGVRTTNVLTLQLVLPEVRYPTGEQRQAFFSQVLEQIGALPGVRRAAAVSSLPMAGPSTSIGVTVEGEPPPPPEQMSFATRCLATPGYFEAVGIRLLQGRLFDQRDGLPNTLPVAIISDTMMKRHWPSSDPLGKRVKFGDPEDDVPWLTVVGVVSDVRHYGLADSPPETMFLPYRQQPTTGMSIVVHTESNPEGLMESVRQAVWSIDHDLPVSSLSTMEAVVRRSVRQPRLFSWLFAVFGLVALGLAAVGVYGVLSYSVVQRTREIGLRMALGAQRRQVLWMVMRQGLWLAGMGLLVGVVGSFLMTRVLRSLLHGISPTDPLTFGGVTAVLMGAALLACALPALRAVRVDPMTALRCD